jgi:hypothetical protein
MISRESLRRRKRDGTRMVRLWDYQSPTARCIGKAGQTRKPCSCPLCGNPRRHCGNGTDGLTLQERRARQKDDADGTQDAPARKA